jgi:hypothetical protein
VPGVTEIDRETGSVEWILRSWHVFPLRRRPIREARCCRRWRRRMRVALERAMRTVSSAYSISELGKRDGKVHGV